MQQGGGIGISSFNLVTVHNFETSNYLKRHYISVVCKDGFHEKVMSDKSNILQPIYGFNKTQLILQWTRKFQSHIHGHLSNYFGQQSFPFLPEKIVKLSCPFPSFTFGQLSFPVPFHFQNFIGLSKTFPESPLISYSSAWVCLNCINPFVNPFELNPC